MYVGQCVFVVHFVLKAKKGEYFCYCFLLCKCTTISYVRVGVLNVLL